MRQAVLTAAGRLDVVDVVRPDAGSAMMALEVIATGVCGSDVHGARGDNDRRRPGTVMGHEIVARTRDGEQVTVNPLVACGHCRACRTGRDNLCPTRRLIGCVPDLPGGFADGLVVPRSNVVPFEGDVPAEWGALVEPLAVGWHAVNRIPADSGDGAVLVIGGGMIGIAAALAASAAGRRVTVAEPVARRRAVLTALGLSSCLPERVESASFAAVLDCVATPGTLATALHAVPPGGGIVLVGFAGPELPLALDPVVQGERTITGSAQYPAATFAATADWAASGSVDLAPLAELRIDLDDLPGAFARLVAGTDLGVKVLVTPRMSSRSA